MFNFKENFDLILTKLNEWQDSIVLSLPNIILVLITYFIGRRVIRFLKKLIKKNLYRLTTNQAVQGLLLDVATVFLYLGLFVLLLTILGLSGTIAGILASAGVAGLAVGLALQEPLTNLFSGVILSSRPSVKIGDYIESNGHAGTVTDVSLSTTILRTLIGNDVVIPNKMIVQNPLKNYSTHGLRRIDIVCGVAYDSDLETVKEIATKAVSKLAHKDVERPVEFVYTDFGDSSINFQLRIWTNPADSWEFINTKSEAIMSIKSDFEKANINIPYPVRTLDLNMTGNEAVISSIRNKN